MSSYRLKDIEIYNEYIKYHLPRFKKLNQPSHYIFCNKVQCRKCKARPQCHKGLRNTLGAPQLNIEQYQRITKEHPEYLV